MSGTQALKVAAVRRSEIKCCNKAARNTNTRHQSLLKLWSCKLNAQALFYARNTEWNVCSLGAVILAAACSYTSHIPALITVFT
jgi:hypothetical protein